MDSLEEWLAPFCRNFTKMSEIKHLQIRQILETMISYEDGQKLKQFAPEKFTVPSGSSIMIDYSDVKQPRLSVKLQELFGLLDTPKLAGEKIPLQLDILSPAMRTIQRTSDLKSFWNESYYLVRKDMRGRYPKHDWPENPLEAIAHKGVKRTAYS